MVSTAGQKHPLIDCYGRHRRPLWNYTSGISGNCDAGWWKNMIFVNNMSPWTDSEAKACMIHAWYLGVEFQLFLVGAFLLVLHAKHPR